MTQEYMHLSEYGVIIRGCQECILVSYPWQPRIIAPYSETCAYCILVSYSWQPRIITPYSERCMYSCVIFLATSYYCTIFQKVCIFLCHILFKLVLLHHVQMVAHSYVILLCGIKVPHDNHFISCVLLTF